MLLHSWLMFIYDHISYIYNYISYIDKLFLDNLLLSYFILNVFRMLRNLYKLRNSKKLKDEDPTLYKYLLDKGLSPKTEVIISDTFSNIKDIIFFRDIITVNMKLKNPALKKLIILHEIEHSKQNYFYVTSLLIFGNLLLCKYQIIDKLSYLMILLIMYNVIIYPYEIDADYKALQKMEIHDLEYLLNPYFDYEDLIDGSFRILNIEFGNVESYLDDQYSQFYRRAFDNHPSPLERRQIIECVLKAKKDEKIITTHLNKICIDNINPEDFFIVNKKVE